MKNELTEFTEKIRLENVKTRAWPAIPRPAHHILVSEAYESHKEAYGYRPSWSALDAMTDVELRTEIDQHAAIIRLKMAEEYRIEREEAEAAAEEARAHAEAIDKAMNPITFGTHLAGAWPARL